MSNTLYKKRIKREVKNHVKSSVIQNIADKIPELQDKLIESFYVIEDTAIVGESIIDFTPFKAMFLERVKEFIFIPEDAAVFTFRIPNMNNFDFTGIEFIEVICEGIVGSFAEVNAVDMLKLYGTLEGQRPINSGLPSDPVYLIPITEWLVNQEKTVLGYTLNRCPFSDTEPLSSLIFGPAQNYFDENISSWISQAIEASLKDATTVYGGKR